MPAHWSTRWLGWRYERGRRECTDFVSEVLAAEFGRQVVFPRAAACVRARDRLIESACEAVAIPLARPPVEGDGVLLRALGRRGVGHHIGVWCAPGGVPSTLHAMEEWGAALHPLDALPGLEVAGLYGWR